jgi:hypothetical protein
MPLSLSPVIQPSLLLPESESDGEDVSEAETVDEIDAAGGTPESFAVFAERVWFVDVLDASGAVVDSQGPMSYTAARNMRDLLRAAMLVMQSAAGSTLELRRRRKRRWLGLR